MAGSAVLRMFGRCCFPARQLTTGTGEAANDKGKATIALSWVGGRVGISSRMVIGGLMWLLGS